jgi:hypothetical protein
MTQGRRFPSMCAETRAGTVLSAFPQVPRSSPDFCHGFPDAFHDDFSRCMDGPRIPPSGERASSMIHVRPQELPQGTRAVTGASLADLAREMKLTRGGMAGGGLGAGPRACIGRTGSSLAPPRVHAHQPGPAGACPLPAGPPILETGFGFLTPRKGPSKPS